MNHLPVRLLTILSVALLASASTALVHGAEAGKLNVILIVADDLGWKDLSCYGSDFYQTPNIDRLAGEGMRFTQFYSACTVCSPTRAALLTGQYPARLHITDWIPGLPPENPKLLVPDWRKFLSPEVHSLPRALKSAGYATASIGKWHLGGGDSLPEKHGFDLNLAGTEAASPPSYFAPYGIATLPDGPPGEYLSDRLGAEAVKWLEQNADHPFFLYLPHFAVHTPIQGKTDVIEKYRRRRHPGQLQTNAQYAALVEGLDDAVGAVLTKVDQLKLTDRTIVIFVSDNGGRVPSTSNLPLRVGKGSCYEGGTRVPLIVRWPGQTKAGSTSDTPVITMDLPRTLLEILGLHQESSNAIDGMSLIPLLRGDGKLERDELFWHYPHYQHYQLGGTTPYGAIRKGNFKLIEFFDDLRVELYNLQDDPGEAHDLAPQFPEKVDALRKRLHEWRAEVKAQMPTPNPEYDPTKPEHTPKPKKEQAAPEAN